MNHAAAGGIIRDHFGKWLHGFSYNIGTCPATAAQLWGALIRFNLAWDLGHSQAWFELDSQTVVLLLLDSINVIRQHSSLIRNNKQLMEKEQVVKIKHAYRESNFRADCLATLAFEHQLGVVY